MWGTRRPRGTLLPILWIGSCRGCNAFGGPADASGTINATWTYEGDELFNHDFFYQSDHKWAYMAITPPAGGFPPGDYQVELVLDDNVSRVVLDFTVTEA